MAFVDWDKSMVPLTWAIKKTQDCTEFMYHSLHFSIDRKAGAPLAEQIFLGLRSAIGDGRLAPQARLPSWHDLAAQLGVARGTVRQAYERLRDEQLVYTAGAAGTFVCTGAGALPGGGLRPAARAAAALDVVQAFPGHAVSTSPFQVGVPAQDAFPFKTWSRVMGRAARAAAAMPVAYPDPRGEQALRAEIAAYLCVARGLDCTPAQVLVCNGYAGALGLALRALELQGTQAWVEQPGYMATRAALAAAGLQAVPVAVDPEGLDVAAGIRLAPHARLAVVTPGQQAPLGVTLSLRRRQALLEWAVQADAWVIEDDYLGELQPQGRAAPALASQDRAGRVLHIGTFSKTLTPSLRLGFLVAPPELADRLAHAASTCGSAPAPVVQLAVAEFLRSGAYLRHLRHMKRLYQERRQALGAALARLGAVHAPAALGVLLQLPHGVSDAAVAAQARRLGMSPSALSGWYAGQPPAQGGLLLGVTNVPEQAAGSYCERLLALVRQQQPA
ncbi:MAG: PLP-dependent aminotransferase family protein [Pseudoduganella sp.]|nr:PLP-dependent aminotransferase family protein [Pseudoduganella sp.]